MIDGMDFPGTNPLKHLLSASGNQDLSHTFLLLYHMRRNIRVLKGPPFEVFLISPAVHASLLTLLAGRFGLITL